MWRRGHVRNLVGHAHQRRRGAEIVEDRTYDNTGTAVMQKSRAAAIVSFSDLTPKLEKGEINAVLSSGDGGAGRQLWKYLRHFSHVSYALPLSFASISLAAWSGRDDAGRIAPAEAANETSEHQWAALGGRLKEDFSRMRANGVVIDEKPPAEVMSPLHAAADATVSEWLSRVGPDA
jgi:TRAP-type C4-dicarboxylate transport system substrate-binding protein